MQFDRRKKIGIGAYSSVFAGTFKGEKVAVKRVQLMDYRGRDEDLDRSVTRSVTVHQLFSHPNIVQFKDYQEDNDFR